MVKRFQVRPDWCFTALLVCTLLSGCTQTPVTASPTQRNAQLRVVGMLLGRYHADNNRIPKDRTEFVEFLNANPSEWAGLGVNTVEEFLASPHDGQPLVLITGNAKAPVSSDGLPWVAYEQTGVDGQYLAINARGTILELNESELSQLFPESK